MSNSCPTTRTKSRSRSRAEGFTLIELLVVIALTAVLLTLLFKPLLFGFQFTSQAQAITEAQDAARVTMEQVSREIASAAAVRDTSSQYLDIRIFTPSTPTTANDEVLAHAYNAYIDIIPARTGAQTAGAAGKPTVADPTVNPYVDTSKGEGFYVSDTTSGQPSLVSSPILLPLSPGTTLVRYFIGLSRPFNLTYTGTDTAAEEQPYINRDESQVPSATESIDGGNDWATAYDIQHNLNNPYILYRAEVSPYRLNAAKTGYIINNQLFAPDPHDSSKPLLDDPDFFRITSDAAHNARVYHWFQAAKPVISSSDANLIFQAHNSYGVVQYSDVSANVGTAAAQNLQTISLPSGTAVESINKFPIVRTSVSFAPATISDQPMNATSTSDVAQGFGSAPADAVVPYIPTQYAAQTGQWSGNKNLLITDNSVLASDTTALPNTYTTYIYNPADSTAAAVPGKNPGDLIEAVTKMSGGMTTSTDVFNVTQGLVLTGPSGTAATYPPNYTVFSASNNGGTVNFSTPDLPLMAVPSTNGGNPALSEITMATGTTTSDAICGDADISSLANPFWYVTFNSSYSDSSYGTSGQGDILQIHLKPQPQLPNYDVTNPDQVLLPNPPLSGSNLLPNIATTSFGAAATYSANNTYASSNGRVAVNSERVYGPDENPGVVPVMVATGAHPANYPVVLYRRIPFNIGQAGNIGADQYMIDYDHGIIYLGQPKSAGGPIDISDSANNPQNSTVLVAFSYQNNAFIPLDTTSHEISPTLLASGGISADTVRATYQTNSRIEVAIGVRLYDAQSNHPTYFSLANAVTVGNANR